MLSVLNIMAPWRSQRQKLGLTQAETAKLVGISRTALSHIENGKSVPSPGTQEGLRRALDPFGNPARHVYSGGPLKAAEIIRRVSKSEGMTYALTLDIAAWLLTGYQTPSTAWAYVRPLESWTQALLISGAPRAAPLERANIVLLRAPDDVLRDVREVQGFRLAPLRRIVEDSCRLGGRHALDAARLYLQFSEARRPGLRLDPAAVIKVWEELGPWM